MTVVIFEDEYWTRFRPLADLRHVSQLFWGTKTLQSGLEDILPAEELHLWGRESVGALTATRTGAEYNSNLKGEALFVNARAQPGGALGKALARKGRFSLSAGGELLAARVDAGGVEPGLIGPKLGRRLAKSVQGLESDHPMLRGTWDLVSSNGLGIAQQAARLRPGQGTDGTVVVKGSSTNLHVHESAEIEPHVAMETQAGPIVIEEGAVVESFSRLSGPCYVGRNARVKSALVRSGTSVFEGSRVGGELENSIIMPYSNKSHLGYVGDSIVGEWVNLGAGSTFSNLKSTYGNVRVEIGEGRFDTGLTKLGPVIGDMAKVSIGCLILSGKTVGTGSQVSGQVKANVPSFTYHDGAEGRDVELLLESVLETQRRMMERRGKTLSKSEDASIRRLFSETRGERKAAGVKKGRIS